MARHRSRKAALVYRDCGFDSHPLRHVINLLIINMFKFLNKNKKEPKNLKEIINYLEELENNFERVSQEIDRIKEKGKFSVQKIGVVRFNPFENVGSDQSFSVALLNGKNNGVVITSLYNREGNRIYGKPINNSSSSYHLSKEELSAIEKAKNSK